MKLGVSKLSLFLVFSFSYPMYSQHSASLRVSDFVHPTYDQFFKYSHDTDISTEHWDQLTEVIFWRKVMRTSYDSIIFNQVGSRRILGTMAAREWYNMPYRSRRAHLYSLRKAFGVRGQILLTRGKSNYYQIHKVIPQLPEVIDVFQQEGVNPWYAQTILLIESPGRLRRSPSGAYGHFQLMKTVAQKYGLTVNRRVDERADLHKSAQAAARLIRISCIPEAKMVLRRVGIEPDEKSLWFRLIVLHIYHAGTGNVQSALQCVRTKNTGIALLRQLWRIRCKDFQSASRNYSQLALAANLELQSLIHTNYHPVVPDSKYQYLQLLSTN